MSYHARTILPPGVSRKRKERESSYYYPFKPTQLQAVKPTPKAEHPEQAVRYNRVLAGYMAHEFLTKGTLLGKKFEAGGAGSGEAAGVVVKKSYGEVASILKSDGAHIPGIVNPSELARWIQM